MSTLLDVGDEVLMSDPGYPCNSNLVSLLGGLPKAVKVTADNDFQLNGNCLSQSWGTATTGVIMASPSNPTGTMVGYEALSELIHVLKSNHGLLLSDEI